jgi:PKD repeat protein
VKSAWNTSSTATNTISGTSMATPHVAGVAALYLQNNAATPLQVRDAIYNATIKGIVNLANSANNHLLHSPPGGFGTVTPPPPAPVVAAYTYSCTDLDCTFSGSASGGAGGFTYSWDLGDGSDPATTANSSHSYSEGTYTVTLTVLDSEGAEDTESKTVTVAAAAPPPPPAEYASLLEASAPTKVKGTWSVALSWAAITDAAAYTVYRNGTALKQTTELTTTDSGKGGGTFTYQVCAAGAAVNQTNCSNPVTITP